MIQINNAIGTICMFDLEDIKKIADYLMVYYKTHEHQIYKEESEE